MSSSSSSGVVVRIKNFFLFYLHPPHCETIDAMFFVGSTVFFNFKLTNSSQQLITHTEVYIVNKEREREMRGMSLVANKSYSSKNRQSKKRRTYNIDGSIFFCPSRYVPNKCLGKPSSLSISCSHRPRST